MIKYYLKNPEWELTRGSDGASGYDLRADLAAERTMEPGERWLISTGLFLEMPLGVEAQVRSRSGLAINHGVVVLNAPGTVDADYRGEVKVSLINFGRHPYAIIPGERIAQLVFAPVYGSTPNSGMITFESSILAIDRVASVEFLNDTKRGAGGHGSTGR